MDETKVVETVFQHYGMGGLLIMWVVWDKILHPMHKKSKGTWKSWDSLDKSIKQLEAKVNGHLENEIQGGKMFAKLQSDHEHLGMTMVTENNHIFSQLADIHLKLDDIMKILVERK